VPYQWDKDKRRYIAPNGKVITMQAQRKIAAQVADKAAEAMTEIATTYTRGGSFASWAVGMRETIKNVHSSMTQLAYGGKSQMGNREQGRLGQIIKEQNKFLAGFAQDVEAGKLSNDQIISRSEMYGDAGYSSYESSVNDREKEAGMTEERSFLEPEADHCEECFDEASKGWSPIDSLIPVGERQCLVRCQCSFEYR
jgi:hypothetical protein